MTEYFQRKLQEIRNDPEQLAAYDAYGNMVVVAGPGSGKTTVLTLKVMRLLNEAICPPRGLACLTYSTEAAREFKDRLAKLGLAKRGNVFLGTVHSFCLAEVLTPFAHLYPKYKIPQPIRIISESQKAKLFNSQGYEGQPRILDVDKERTRNIRGISRVALDSYEVALKAAISFDDLLLQNGYIDFISMVKLSVDLIQNELYVRKALEAKFPWVVIDEYQDLGRPLHEIVLALLNLTNIKVFAVGDADQSIYDFQGAAPEYLIELSRRTDVESIRLKNNYRSSQVIVDASEHVLECKRGYIASGRLCNYQASIEFCECESGMDEQYYAAMELIREFYEKGTPFHEIAILVSNNNQVKELYAECTAQGIPAYFARQEFRNTDPIFWLQSCACWLQDNNTRSFDEICSVWKGFLLSKRNNIIDENEHLSIKRNLLRILTLSRIHKDNLYEWLRFIFTRLNICALFSGLDRYPDEIENFKKLIQVAKETEPTLTIDFIARLGMPNNQVILSTRHSAKGLEFDSVIMLGMEKDSFPNYYDTTVRQQEEARRLCFVAVSRARKACVLIRSKQLPNKYGRWFPKEPSPFWITLKGFQDERLRSPCH